MSSYEGIDEDKIVEWFTEPEDNYDDIIQYMTYMYISDGTIYQLYTLFQSLPKLNYKIKVFDRKAKNVEDNLILYDKTLYSVGYKKLTRDIIGQLCLTGTLICTWLGNKKNPYLYIFENNQYIFSSSRRNGKWVAMMDMAWIDNMTDIEKEQMYETLKDIGLKSNYDKYQKDSTTYKYLELPIDRTTVIKNNTILRNQRIGLPLGMQSLLDIQHKKTLRQLEENIVEKIIKSIAVLTIGDKEHDYKDIGSPMRKKIISSVQTAIKKSVSASGVPVSVLPQYASLMFPDVKGLEVFNDGADKFEEVNNAIQAGIGVNGTLTGSNNGSNYQSAKLSMDVLYSRIGMMLESIQEIFQQLFSIVLSKKISENYAFEFITGTPLSTKDEVDILQKLHAEGTSYKSIVDMLNSVSYMELLDDSKREIDDMGIREIITPPKTSSTLSAEDSETGRKAEENPDNENTIKSQETGGNLIDGSTE